MTKQFNRVDARSREEVLEEFRLQTITAAALRVIAREGRAGATMQQVADEAGIAKGTIYLYFKNREELLRSTAEHACAELSARLDAALAAADTTGERLRVLVATKIRFFDEHRDFIQSYLSVAQGEAALDRRRRHPRFQAHLARVARVLEAGIKAGEIRPQDPERLALFVNEGINAVVLRRLSEARPPEAEAEADWIVDALLDGLSVRRRGAR